MTEPANPTKKQYVWLITGTSSGFGKRLVLAALSRGDRVVATARSLTKLEAALEGYTFSPEQRANLHTLELDITWGEERLRGVIDHAAAFWGRIDVLVNNAGYGQPTLLEEGGSKIARQHFEVNVFSLLDMTSAALPHIRASKGIVVNIGSRMVWNAEVTGCGYYASSKAAIQALTETLSAELAPFGVRVLLVAPGSFRTEGIWSYGWYTGNPLPEYDTLRETGIKRNASIPGNEKGDPDKAMDLLVDVVREEGKASGREFPKYLVLGEDGMANALVRAKKIADAIESWKDVAGKALEFNE